jgi:TPR repeat protein
MFGFFKKYAEAGKMQKDANMGVAEAQFWAGYCYYTGQGVTEDYAEAVNQLRKGVNQNVVEAQFDLKKCFFSQVRTDYEYAQAVKWFWKAAEQNHAKAQGCLGLCYATGAGVPRDFIKAYKWFNLASIQGIVSATTHRDAIAASMTPDQIAEAQRLSREFKPIQGIK